MNNQKSTIYRALECRPGKRSLVLILMKEIRPQDYWSRYRRDEALQQLGRVEEAIASFDQAISD